MDIYIYMDIYIRQILGYPYTEHVLGYAYVDNMG